MQIITDFGDQGLELPDGRCARLRPSFYAMTQLGTPTEIVEKFTRLHSGPTLLPIFSFDPEGVRILADSFNRKAWRDHWRDMLFLSWEILTACGEGDLEPFIGCPGVRYGSYRFGPMPAEDMLVLARNLMQHGVIGPMPVKSDAQKEHEASQPRDASKFTREFRASEFVSKAVAHLGVCESAAWGMTLTGFAAHWQAKFGEHKEQRHSQEHDETMTWLTKVNKARAEKR